MCGIIAVVRRAAERQPPIAADLVADLVNCHGLLGRGVEAAAVASIAEQVDDVDRLLRGVPGVLALIGHPDAVAGLRAAVEQLVDEVEALERDLDRHGAPGADAEAINRELVRLRDGLWAIARDRLRTAHAVELLAGPGAGDAAVAAFTSVQAALSALDRLEVRGRDSAGLHLLVSNHGLDTSAADVVAAISARSQDELFCNSSVRVVDGRLSFVYKAAAEIGELGDNTRALRAAIAADELLHRALAGPDAEMLVVGHTRWASVGIISEPNAHPLNSEQEGDDAAPYCTGVLNGDVDNFADLRAADGLRIHGAITTDAKVIPTLVSARLASGDEPVEAFRRTVTRLEGSVATAVDMAADPDRLFCALRGSGQALYVGLAEDQFIVASEPYGVVEETDTYLRLDGETPADPDSPTTSRGQIVVLDRRRAGEVEGIRRLSYDGTELPVEAGELARAEITTRDIDRGDYPHFLLKEISESPRSFRKTLRGKLVEHDGSLRVVLADSVVPQEVRSRLRTGEIGRVLVIGQGTAAVAGQSLARALVHELEHTTLQVEALPATELSGFHLRSDMADTLVVAISQSGTTTDTNRTVDLVRARGAAVIAIVNRRNSDLTDKADGVLYTSDGRDVEMSVASTKAFYSQVAAGWLLAIAIADEARADDDLSAKPARQGVLTALRELPDLMEQVLTTRGAIAATASELAPSRRYWAIVGNGPNRVAASEVRIKLSELCYKSIAADATEDKKHIDLSSEPLILVCAAGLGGSTADDVAKEVAIYRAHKAAPIVVADEGVAFPAALSVLRVPVTHPSLAFVLSTMVGHLFGYEAALAIDAQAAPLRQTRSAIEQAVAARPGQSGEQLLAQLRPRITTPAQRFFDGLRRGDYDGHLEASTGVRVASSYRYAIGAAPLEAYQLDFGRVGTPGTVLEDLTSALTLAIEELTRPIDAIKHQAKTVTVGISRSDESLLELELLRSLLDTGTPRDRLTYPTLRTLAALDPAVQDVLGFIRYGIEGDPAADAHLSIIDRGGVARDLPSRVDRDPLLRGSKHLVAVERKPLVTRGRRDQRTVIIVPETKDQQAVGITLLHVRFADRLRPAVARGVLDGYRNRFAALRDYVQETEPTFREDLLGEIDVIDLLIEPLGTLADRWRVME
ncbi:MAG: SIS domain-containing protein [Acidimicrobiales bacterium]|nr:SIS domain-containing protein [Acidimicrobiales bacterium]